MSTTIEEPSPLPATIADQRLWMRVFCPPLRRYAKSMREMSLLLFLTEGDLAVDAQQLVEVLGIPMTRDTFVTHPLQWTHQWRDPLGVAADEVFLWRRDEAMAAAVALAADPQLGEDVAVWIEEQYVIAYEDFQETLDRLMPIKHGTADSSEVEVLAAARALTRELSVDITRPYLFRQMELLGWIERDTEQLQHGRWRVTVEARPAGMVISRMVKIPGGTYEQVWITQAGLAALTEHLRSRAHMVAIDGGAL